MSGHEAMHLAKCLNEELAQQQACRRAKSPEAEARSRSYDNKEQEVKMKGIIMWE